MRYKTTIMLAVFIIAAFPLAEAREMLSPTSFGSIGISSTNYFDSGKSGTVAFTPNEYTARNLRRTQTIVINPVLGAFTLNLPSEQAPQLVLINSSDVEFTCNVVKTKQGVAFPICL